MPDTESRGWLGTGCDLRRIGADSVFLFRRVLAHDDDQRVTLAERSRNSLKVSSCNSPVPDWLDFETTVLDLSLGLNANRDFWLLPRQPLVGTALVCAVRLIADIAEVALAVRVSRIHANSKSPDTF